MMHTCTKCQRAQSWQPFTDSICDVCWENNNATKKLDKCPDCGSSIDEVYQCCSNNNCDYFA